MEVFQTENYYIFVRKSSKDTSLWWNRESNEFTIKAGWDFSSVDDIECIGLTTGIIGVISLPGVYEPHLVIVREATPVGVLYPPHLVYKIKSICILGDDIPDTQLIGCPRHSNSNRNNLSTANAPASAGSARPPRQTIWGAVKSAGNTIKSTTQHAAALATNQIRSTSSNVSCGRDSAKIEKRITDELHKMFDDSDSFFYCPDADITHNLQRRRAGKRDDRFFWNMHMLRGILELGDESWVQPIVQGFIQVEQCEIDGENFTLALVSRRSRYRAGTRYKRRGVDENGHCANYVETEQILTFRSHQMAFTQVRGSVPVFWSQPGFKYRPPPRLDRDPSETQLAFAKHFCGELDLYDAVYIVNLVEQAGKEKIIFDAYGEHIVKLNSDRLTYVTFDFHDYCRGMRFENVSALIEAVAPDAGAMGFNWHDAKGSICRQKSIFRVNCMDCLDRTNVVQTAFGKTVLESQLVKLGLAPPYSPIPEAMKQPFMMVWANNGDIISRQYAGTNALKGDYTRTGERKLTGLMKDGMNSANRYYLARFKDAYRQATIDLMLGNEVSAESLNALGGHAPATDESEAVDGAEHARVLVEDCRRMLLGSAQYPIGAWGLIDADPNTGDLSETEVDNILLLTDELYLVAEYDSHLDKIVRFERVPLAHITLIEFGIIAQSSKLFQSSSAGQQHPSIRINYTVDGQDGYFHMFRSANIRFFNNVAMIMKTADEVTESLLAIVEFFRIALDNRGHGDVPIVTNAPLQRRKSRTPMLDVPKGMPRNLSESQLVQIGSKAFSNVAGQFSKLGQSLNPTKIRSGTKTDSPSNDVRHPQPPIVCSPSANSLEMATVADEQSMAKFVLGGSGNLSDDDSSQRKIDNASASSSGSSPPSHSGGAGDAATGCDTKYNENTFLPGVGIVMASHDETANAQFLADAQQQQQQQHHHQLHTAADYASKRRSADVCTMSISSVTDHVNMPVGMLECGSPTRGRSPAPEIRVDDVPQVDESSSGGMERSAFSRSSDQVQLRSTMDTIGNADRSGNRDLSLNLSSSQSESAIKQLKTLTSPLSKLATGMKSFGMNLDPRKMAIKSPVSDDGLTPIPRNEVQNQKLQEKWVTSECKSKLIAL